MGVGKCMDARTLVRRWAEAISGRDVATVLNLSHPDIECQPLRLDCAYRGHGGLVNWMLDLEATSVEDRVSIAHVERLSAHRFAAFGTVQIEGEDVSPYTVVAVVRDAKVAAVRSYLSDKATMERLGLLR